MTLRALIAVVVLFAGCIPAMAANEPIVIRFSHVVAEDTPKGIAANMFKERAEAAFPGRVKVEVYPASRRFTDEEVLLALLFGDIQMAAPSFTLFRAFSPSTQVFELPFLFNTVEQVHRFQESEDGKKLLSSMENRGIKGLA
ncbi:MAG: TRAP transporter substrate-binding protein DctP [Rhodospirillales bacterium]|nr:TRAP transporter substrate-binding protein DctP [Rhodospirillales bacterium]